MTTTALPLPEPGSYDCGAPDCCGGEDWPDCQAAHREPPRTPGAAFVSIESDGELRVTHYSDEQGCQSPFCATD